MSPFPSLNENDQSNKTHSHLTCNYRGADGTARLWPIADSPDSKTVQSVTLDHQLSTDNFKAMTKDITAVDWNVSF